MRSVIQNKKFVRDTRKTIEGMVSLIYLAGQAPSRVTLIGFLQIEDTALAKRNVLAYWLR